MKHKDFHSINFVCTVNSSTNYVDRLSKICTNETLQTFLPAIPLDTHSFIKYPTRNAGSTVMLLSFSFLSLCSSLDKAKLPPSFSLSSPCSVKLWHLVRGSCSRHQQPTQLRPPPPSPTRAPPFCMILIDSFIDCKEIGRSYNTAGLARVMKKGGTWFRAWMAAWVAAIYCHTRN